MYVFIYSCLNTCQDFSRWLVAKLADHWLAAPWRPEFVQCGRNKPHGSFFRGQVQKVASGASNEWSQFDSVGQPNHFAVMRHDYAERAIHQQTAIGLAKNPVQVLLFWFHGVYFTPQRRSKDFGDYADWQVLPAH
jgi:hypothetical protein